MNKQRRRRIADLTNELDILLDALTDIRDEEQEAFDNMPEGWPGHPGRNRHTRLLRRRTRLNCR